MLDPDPRWRSGLRGKRVVTDLHGAGRGDGGLRARSLGHVEFPYVFLDAHYLKGRVGGQVVSRAVVVATGVAMTGDQEVLSCAVGDSEDEAFWTEFLRSLRARGLTGMRLVITLVPARPPVDSDHHPGLKKAITTVMIGRRLAALPLYSITHLDGRSWARAITHAGSALEPAFWGHALTKLRGGAQLWDRRGTDGIEGFWVRERRCGLGGVVGRFMRR